MGLLGPWGLQDLWLVRPPHERRGHLANVALAQGVEAVKELEKMHAGHPEAIGPVAVRLLMATQEGETDPEARSKWGKKACKPLPKSGVAGQRLFLRLGFDADRTACDEFLSELRESWRTAWIWAGGPPPPESLSGDAEPAFVAGSPAMVTGATRGLRGNQIPVDPCPDSANPAAP